MAGSQVLQGLQQRLTNILVADVAGFSQLAGADEEDTITRLRKQGVPKE